MSNYDEARKEVAKLINIELRAITYVLYKKGIEEMPGYDEISEELLHSARAIIEADNEMQRIKDKIGMFHEIQAEN